MSKQVDIFAGGPVTPEYILAISKAAVDGKKIQYKTLNNGLVTWDNKVYPWTDLAKSEGVCAFNWVSYTFRVDPTDKPKKKVPLTLEDIGTLTWVRKINSNIWYHVTGKNVDNNTIFIASPMGGIESVSLDNLFDENREKGIWEYTTDGKTWRPTHKEIIVDA